MESLQACRDGVMNLIAIPQRTSMFPFTARDSLSQLNSAGSPCKANAGSITAKTRTVNPNLPGRLCARQSLQQRCISFFRLSFPLAFRKAAIWSIGYESNEPHTHLQSALPRVVIPKKVNLPSLSPLLRKSQRSARISLASICCSKRLIPLRSMNLSSSCAGRTISRAARSMGDHLVMPSLIGFSMLIGDGE